MFQAEDGIRDTSVTGVQTCALPISSIKALKPSEKRHEVWDAKTAGLCIRISPTGVKTYQVVKKLHGKTKRITLGKESDLTVEQARKKASRSEERRVGKECRARWSRSNEKKNKKEQ